MSQLPIAKRVYASLSSDLWDKDIIKEIESDILADNRDAKIDSIISDVPFEEKKLEDDERYKKMTHLEVKPLPPPINMDFYLDFTFKK
jgi:hypothetical protein